MERCRVGWEYFEAIPAGERGGGKEIVAAGAETGDR